MRTSTLIALAAAGVAQLASAHSTVFNILVNDVTQGAGNSAAGYIRSPPNNDPVKDVTSKDMTCNVGNTAAAKTISVKGGDKITFEWHHNDASASDDIIAESHHGPVMTYIAPTASNGAGNVWIKLAEEGYANGKWAVDNLIANKGKHSITLPDLAAGEYLLRPEILALHEGMTLGGAQWYMECVQIKVTSAGTKTLPAGVAIPGTYSAEDAGVHFDIYNGFTSYPIPGPKVWDGASGSAPATSAAAAASSSKAAVVSSAAPVVASSTKAAVPAVTSAAVSSPAAPAKTTFVTSIKAITKTVAPSATPAPATGTGSVAIYQQCGGNNYNGPTGCATGLVCNKWNDWYSQCLTPGTF